jgi:outer membrane protein
MRSTTRSASVGALFLAVAGALIIAPLGAGEAQTTGRVAYVNPQALFANAPGRAKAESIFTKETETYRAELNRMSDALQAMVSSYQKDEPRLTAADKERRQRAIGFKEDSLRGRQQQLEQQASQRQSELMAPIMESVRKVLEDIRAEDGYALIFSSEPGASPILAADKNLDITDRVVARLKTMAATQPTTPQRPAGPANAPSGVTRPKPPGM